jgi:hypothetical protein
VTLLPVRKKREAESSVYLAPPFFLGFICVTDAYSNLLVRGLAPWL